MVARVFSDDNTEMEKLERKQQLVEMEVHDATAKGTKVVETH